MLEIIGALVGAVLLTLLIIPILYAVSWVQDWGTDDDNGDGVVGILVILGLVLTLNPFTFIVAALCIALLLYLAPFAAAFMLLYWVIGPTVAILYVATLIGLVVIVAPIAILIGVVIAHFVNPDDVTTSIMVGSIAGSLLVLVFLGGY